MKLLHFITTVLTEKAKSMLAFVLTFQKMGMEISERGHQLKLVRSDHVRVDKSDHNGV